MSSITGKTTGRKTKTTGQKARNHAVPHVAEVVAKAKRIGRKAARYVPTATRCGFKDGRKMGNEAVGTIPYAVGIVSGFSFGLSEAIVGAVAKPAKALFGLGVGLGAWAHRQFCEDEDKGEVEVH